MPGKPSSSVAHMISEEMYRMGDSAARQGVRVRPGLLRTGIAAGFVLASGTAVTGWSPSGSGGNSGEGNGDGPEPGGAKPAPGSKPAPGTSTGTSPSPGAAPSPGPRARGKSLDSAWRALGEGLDGMLLRPGEHDFTAARKLFNPRFDTVRPAGVAYCAGDEDVRECLEFARRHGVPVAIRSGGHASAGWSTGKDRLIVDVQKMAEVTASGRTATVGAGAKLIDVYDRLNAHHRTIPAGTCPTLGVSGLALGGGIGAMARAYGLTSDSVTAARIVTADGRIRDVDEGRDSDLFWALRGAGNANFGVVTSLSFRTHVAPQCVTFFLSWPWSRAAEVVREWQRWAPAAPEEIWANLRLSAPAGGRPGSVRVGGLSLGARRELENQLDRLADRIGAPASDVVIRRHAFMEAMKVMGGVSGRTLAQAHQRGSLPGRRTRGKVTRESYATRSDFYTRSIPADGVRALLARVEALGTLGSKGGAGTVGLEALGGAAGRPAAGSTAFVHREARFLARYSVTWPDHAAARTVAGRREWLDGTHTAMRPWASGHAYQNHPDPALPDWRHAYYGANAERLAKIKAVYDPDRLFTFPQAL